MNITYEQILAVMVAKDLTIENQRQQIAALEEALRNAAPKPESTVP